MKVLRPRHLLFALHELSWDLLTRPDRHALRRAKIIPVRLWLEPLEDRTLLSVSISGTIFNDLHGTGVRTPDDPIVPGAVAYVVPNTTGSIGNLGQPFTYTSPAGPTTFNSVDPTGNSGLFAFSDPIVVSGLSSSFSHLQVHLSLQKTQAGAVRVALLSSAGFNAGAGPDLLTLFDNTGTAWFNGTFDDTAAGGIPTVSHGNSSATAPLTGSFRPLQTFSDPSQLLYNDNPNGDWQLVFYPAGSLSVYNFNGVNLLSWSIQFSGTAMSDQADSNGLYSFSDLAPGPYTVSVANAASVTPATVTVPSTGAGVSGADIGIVPQAHLSATSFQVVSPPGAGWGTSVQVNYTIANTGGDASAAAQAEIRLSTDSTIDTTDTLLTSVVVPALQPGASTTGSVTVTLPASGAAPADEEFLGLGINDVYANQGNGIDLAPAVSFGNQAVSASTAVQINSSVVVDPTNSNHLVMAYTDYSLATTGYGGIGIAESTDGGTTWKHSSLPLAATFPDYAGAADHATVKFDAQGNVFVSFMALTYKGTYEPELAYPDGAAAPGTSRLKRSFGMQASNGIFVAYNTGARDGQGNLSWNITAVVQNPWTPGSPKVFFDALPSLAIDTFTKLPNGSPNPRAGTLYVTWTRAYPTGQYPISGGTSINGGTDIMLATATLATLMSPSGQWTIRTRASKSTSVIQIPFLRDATTTSKGTTDNNDTAGTGAQEGGGLYNYSQVTVGPSGDVFVSYQEGSRDRVLRLANTDPTHSTFDFTPVYTAGATANDDPFPSDSLTVNAPGYGNTPLSPFRTFPERQIVADPTRPGVLYAVEVIQTKSSDSSHALLDQGDIYFARSVDNAKTWQRLFTVGGSDGNLDSYAGNVALFKTPLNDDDGNRLLNQTPASAAGSEVTSTQALPHLTVDAQGNIVVVWYDSRRSASGTQFDVFTTVSSDGGQSFTANSRITDTTMTPAAATFTDAAGQPDDTLGDFIGVTAANGVAYVAWTDTRTGVQNIYLNRFALQQPPPHLPNRFEPDGSPATAANLGIIAGRQSFPKLVATGGVVDFYRVTPGASGSFLVTLSATQTVLLQVFDVTGKTLLAQGASLLSGTSLIGQQLLLRGVAANVPLLVEVSGVAPGQASVPYSLAFQALTADFGTTVTAGDTNSVVAGGVSLYAVTMPIGGTLQVQLTGQTVTGSLNLTILNGSGTAVLATGQPINGTTTGGTETAAVSVTAGQVLLLKVAGSAATSTGTYALQLNLRDQFQTSPETSLLFPILGGAPVALAVGKLDGTGNEDIATVNSDLADPISILVNNGHGLFEAGQTFDAGTGSASGTARGLVLDSFKTGGSANALDLAITNFLSDDVSVLLNQGNATFGSDHRSDALPFPGSIASADFNGDGNRDLVVFPAFTPPDQAPEIAVLLGRGDGTFAPPQILPTDLVPGSPVYGIVGDFTGNHRGAIAVFSATNSEFDVFLPNADGTFTKAPLHETSPAPATAVVAADLRGLGRDDIAIGTSGAATVYVLLSNGDGTFTSVPQGFNVNTDPARRSSQVIGLAVGNLGGADASGNSQLGTGTGRLDLVVVTKPLIGIGLPQLNLLSQLTPAVRKTFGGFATATQLATGNFTGPVATGDLVGNSLTDIAVVDGNNVRVVYNQGLSITPNTQPAAARDLGHALHVLTPQEVIAPGFEDAYFNYTVPTETAPGAGKEVVDFSAFFGNLVAPGLQMEILGTGAAVNPTGADIRVVVPQGTVLTVHVFGADGPGGVRGAGTYELDIDVLPQVVRVAAQALEVDGNGLPTGPINSIVLTFQGDQLQQAAAETTGNYKVTLLGAGGKQVITDLLSAVIDTAADPQVSSGRTFPGAVEQTVTLIFAQPLAPGTYEIDLAPALQSVAFDAAEPGLLSGGHPLVSVANGQIGDGASVLALDLVHVSSQAPDFGQFNQGTPFLTNLHDDLGAVLNIRLTDLGAQPNEGGAVTQALLDQIIARFAPIVGAQGQSTNYLVIVLDPVGIELDGGNGRAQYSLQAANSLNASARNTIARSYFEVGGNVEVMVLATALGTYTLNISDVAAGSRGAAVIFANGTVTAASLTDAIRQGQNRFDFVVPGAAVAAATFGQPAAGSAAAASISTGAGSAGSFFFTGLPELGFYGVGDQLAVSLLLTLVELGGGSILTLGVSGDTGLSVAPSGVGETQPVAPMDEAMRSALAFGFEFGFALGFRLGFGLGLYANQNPSANQNRGGNPAPNTAPNPNGTNPRRDQDDDLEAASTESAQVLPSPPTPFPAGVDTEDFAALMEHADSQDTAALDPCLAAAVFTAGLCQTWFEYETDSEASPSKPRWCKEWLQSQV
jgi:hypothetical protein